MSEMEHDQKTEEMFEVVNSHASDESKRQAEQIHRQTMEADLLNVKVAMAQEKAAWRRERRTKAVCGMILRLLVCTVAAALFVAALLLPNWVPVLCFAGLAACLIIGTVVTDSCIRKLR